MGRKRSNAKTYEVYKELKKMIVSLTIPPGQLLMESDLTEKFKVSRTPVRESMIMLIQEGFLVEKDNRIYVSQLTISDIHELFQIREALENKAVELAIKKITLEQINKLKEINEQLKSSFLLKDIPRFSELDEEFHTTLIKYSGNGRILEAISNLNLQISRIRYLTILNKTKTELTYDEHNTIIAALEEGNIKAAQCAVSNHINLVEETVQILLNFTNEANIGIYNL